MSPTRLCALFSALAACAPSGGRMAANTALTPATHAKFPIAGGPHAVDCNSCHGDFASFKDFTCLSCHAHEQSTTDQLHASVSGYGWESASCLRCHASGEKVPFDHKGITAACATCHDAGATFAALPKAGFTHPDRGGNDCRACHVVTTWTGAGVAPAGASDPAQSLVVQALIPTYAGTSIAALAPRTEPLPMPMNHAAVSPLPSCATCHAGASAGAYFPGVFHPAAASQPSACLDCHAASVPSGFVGSIDASRRPASGAMKHDAVVWQNGAPTNVSAVTQDCSVCHLSPSPSASTTWSMGRNGASPALFHAPLGTSQPAECLDCHANSRPAATLSLPAGTTFDHTAPAAMADCAACHSSVQSWTGGRFHLAGSPAPSSCLPCHASERPATTAGWTGSYQAAPFDFGTNAAGVTHGAGLDCAACHRTSTQTWASGRFAHGAGTPAASTCIACHMSQRPDLQANATAAGMATTLGFDHSINGTGDCLGCHAATTTYVTWGYDPGTQTFTGSDWHGGQAYPGSSLIGALSQSITVTETTLVASGGLVTGASSLQATLYNQMRHTSTAVPASIAPGPDGSPNYSTCFNCHTASNTATGAPYAGGTFHPALNTLGLPQPAGQCGDCHVTMRPSGIVELAASDLQPMDHFAFAAVSAMECSACHATTPGTVWSDGAFHAHVNAGQSTCTTCHYPLMADPAKADVTSGSNYKMAHRSSRMTFQNCVTCHTAALAQATRPPASTLWAGGSYHPNLGSAQPAGCLDCHAVSVPGVPTQSSFTYAGQAQWMSHASTQVSGKDCAACHLADAVPTGAAWIKSDSFHAAVTSPSTCRECHGLSGGNNIPAGLTSSSTLTSASTAPAGTYDQIAHTDVNVTGHDCNFCHVQAGVSSQPGIQGKEWAQAGFHASFTAGTALVMNGTTGRCSDCHLNLKPAAGLTAQDHSAFSATPGTQDCSACHSFPGTGTTSSPNWLGATNVPQYISVGGFTIPSPPAPSPASQAGINNLPHPTLTTGETCASCHAGGSGGKNAIGYDHASTLIASNCGSCHETGSNLVGTAWNGSTLLGDTRPYTLTSVRATYKGNTSTETTPNHFFLDKGGAQVDCFRCHVKPAATSLTTTTGTAYATAWAFKHPPESPSYNYCYQCHPNGPPN